MYYAGSTITDWIQALSAVAGLGGLAIYAFDTHTIRNATLSQSDASRRPFFRFDINVLNHLTLNGIEHSLIAKNVGNGHALRFQIFNGRRMPLQDVADGFAIPIDGEVMIMQDKVDALKFELMQTGGIYVTYRDLAGKTYWSTYKQALDRSGTPIPHYFVTDSGEC